ncbi:MAG: acyltransferase [Acidobacteriota bacterium]|nr:acyltransferase [Acidobacteriota bacterium]
MAKDASVVFGAGCVIDNRITVECRGKIEVGARTVFGHHGTLAAAELISIGEDCLIAEMVSIRDHDHSFTDIGVPYNQQGQAVAPVRIGSNVWLGCKVTVIKGVTIGNNTVVGANAVVTHDLPSDCVAAGIPARVLRYFDAAKRSDDSS